MKFKKLLVLCVLVLVTISCGLPKAKPAAVTPTKQPPANPQAQVPSATPTMPPAPAGSVAGMPTNVPGAATAAPGSPDNGGTPTTVPQAPQTGGAPTKVPQDAQTGGGFSSFDPCKSLSKPVAEKVIGETVSNTIPAGDANYKSCIVMTASQKSALFTITNTEMAKKNFINEILQYKKGCDIHYTGGSATATPFPADGQALMNTPLLQLFTDDLKLQTACGGVSKPLPVLGPNAYTVPTFLKAGVAGIVQDEMFLTFTYSDMAASEQDMQNRAIDLARLILNK